MKDTWLKIILIFSLAFNCAVLGAIGYPLAKQYWRNRTEPPVLQEIPPENVPPQVLQSRSAFRKRMLQERIKVRDERDQLAQLLMAQPPDKQKIQDKILTIANLQGKIQQTVVEQILAETAAMPPEQRRLYLSNIQGKMCQGQCGRGPGFGGRRGRMNRPCP
jgi:uncharacterized membrane protein